MTMEEDDHGERAIETTPTNQSTQPFKTRKVRPGIDAWNDMFQIVLAEEDSIAAFAEALRERVQTSPMQIYDQYIHQIGRAHV